MTDKDLDRDTGDELVSQRSLESHRKRIIGRTQKHRTSLINPSRKIVPISLLIVLIAFVIFGTVIYWRLYHLQDHSHLSYNITKVLPLPVAKVGPVFVSYKDYLRHLQRQIYYFENHQEIDFAKASEDEAITLVDLRNNAIQATIDQVYVRFLAAEHDLSVSEAEIDSYLALIESQEGDIENILQDFWNLNLADYREVLRDEILEAKVIAKMDEILGGGAFERMTLIKRRLDNGEDFAVLAQEYSEDIITATNGGEYDFLFDRSQQGEDLPVLQAVFNTPVGSHSEIVNVGHRLEIIKVLEEEDGLRRVAHISISYLTLDTILADIRQNKPPDIYIDNVRYRGRS